MKRREKGYYLYEFAPRNLVLLVERPNFMATQRSPLAQWSPSGDAASCTVESPWRLAMELADSTGRETAMAHLRVDNGVAKRASRTGAAPENDTMGEEEEAKEEERETEDHSTNGAAKEDRGGVRAGRGVGRGGATRHVVRRPTICTASAKSSAAVLFQVSQELRWKVQTIDRPDCNLYWVASEGLPFLSATPAPCNRHGASHALCVLCTTTNARAHARAHPKAHKHTL